jgi:hypothetical protein
VERTNSDVVRMLRACVLDDRVVPSALVSWAELTPWIQRNINRAMSSKTRKAPVQLLYGDRVDLDRELFDPLPENLLTGPAVKIGGYVQALIDSYDGCLQAALAHQAAQLARVVASRRLVPDAQFVPGEWVLVRLPPDQVHDKMEPRWEGPFRVLARTGDHSYTVLDTIRAAERRVRDVHVTTVCRFDWAWLDIPADDEVARAAGDAGHERRLEGAVVDHRERWRRRGRRRLFLRARAQHHRSDEQHGTHGASFLHGPGPRSGTRQRRRQWTPARLR